MKKRLYRTYSFFILSVAVTLWPYSAMAQSAKYRSVAFAGKISYLMLFIERAAMSQLAGAPMEGGVSSPDCLNKKIFIDDLKRNDVEPFYSLNDTERSRALFGRNDPTWKYGCRFVSNGPFEVLNEAPSVIVRISFRIPRIIDEKNLETTIATAQRNGMLLPPELLMSEARARSLHFSIHGETSDKQAIHLWTYPSLEIISQTEKLKRMRIAEWITGMNLRTYPPEISYFDIEFTVLD